MDLERIVAERIAEVCDFCDNQTRDNYNNLMLTLVGLKKQIPSSVHHLIFEIETLFNNQTRLSVENSYRIGVSDGALMIEKIKAWSRTPT